MSLEPELQLKEIQRISKEIRDNTVTEKTIGGKYPIRLGYATAVRRPIQDILHWMHGVEEILGTLIEEAKK